MINSFFEEKIFPPIERVQVVKPAQTYVPTYTTKDTFELLYCDTKRAWVSLNECLHCPTATRLFSDIMEDMMGCI